MSMETRCPACDRPLRVPPELAGKNVKCPACGEQFLAGESAAPAAAEAREPPPYDAGYDDEPLERPHRGPERPSRNAALAVVRPPAICLMVAGIVMALGGLGYLGYGIFMLTMMDQLLKDFEENFRERQRAGQVDPAQQPNIEQARQLFRWIGYGYIGYGIVSVLLSAAIMWGSVSMMQLRSRGMAITASILAMIPISMPCCILGLGFGIWALVVLVRNDVASAFRAAASENRSEYSS